LTLEEVVTQLATRVRSLEDELMITRLLTAYGLAVDGNDADGCADLYSPEAEFWLDGEKTLSGRAELSTIVTSEAHQAILPGCAHVMGPFAVEVSGDRATATGYATVFVAESGGRQIWRQSFGRWELTRTESGWRVQRRDSWAIGLPGGQQAARRALHVQLAGC
jgi:ketosteroid isomerase-like protein